MNVETEVAKFNDFLYSNFCKIESELAELPDAERDEYLKELGMTESGLDKIIRSAYKTLGLITFITAGPKNQKRTCLWY